LADNATDIDIIEEKYVPMISDSIIEDEKVRELISTTRNVIRHEAQTETMSMLAQAEEKTVELEQQPIELEPEQEYIDTTMYMYDNVSSEVYYAENVMEETTNMMEIDAEEIVIIDTYTDCLVAYNGSRCGEKVIEQQEIVANGYIVDSTTAKEPMSMINQLKEVVSTLSRNKRKEVEAEWTEYSNYALVAYNEGKRELTNYLEQQINKYIN
jgi:3-phosphoglycerate kinase